MTTVQIELPSDIAEKAANAGLLRPEIIAQLLRARLAADAWEKLDEMREKLEGLPEMSMEEIDAELKAHRAKERRAARS